MTHQTLVICKTQFPAAPAGMEYNIETLLKSDGTFEVTVTLVNHAAKKVVNSPTRSIPKPVKRTDGSSIFKTAPLPLQTFSVRIENVELGEDGFVALQGCDQKEYILNDYTSDVSFSDIQDWIGEYDPGMYSFRHQATLVALEENQYSLISLD